MLCVIKEREKLGGEGREKDFRVVIFLWRGGDFDDSGGFFII